MVGLDRLLGLQAQTLLERIIGLMEANFFKDPAWIELLQNLSNSLNPIENVIAQVFFFVFMVAIHELLCLKNTGAHISMFFTSKE